MEFVGSKPQLPTPQSDRFTHDAHLSDWSQRRATGILNTRKIPDKKNPAMEHQTRIEIAKRCFLRFGGGLRSTFFAFEGTLES